MTLSHYINYKLYFKAEYGYSGFRYGNVDSLIR